MVSTGAMMFERISLIFSYASRHRAGADDAPLCLATVALDLLRGDFTSRGLFRELRCPSTPSEVWRDVDAIPCTAACFASASSEPMVLVDRSGSLLCAAEPSASISSFIRLERLGEPSAFASSDSER